MMSLAYLAEWQPLRHVDRKRGVLVVGYVPALTGTLRDFCLILSFDLHGLGKLLIPPWGSLLLLLSLCSLCFSRLTGCQVCFSGDIFLVLLCS